MNLASQRIKDVVQQNALKHLVFEYFLQKEETNLSEESIYAQLLSNAVARRQNLLNKTKKKRGVLFGTPLPKSSRSTLAQLLFISFIKNTLAQPF